MSKLDTVQSDTIRSLLKKYLVTRPQVQGAVSPNGGVSTSNYARMAAEREKEDKKFLEYAVQNGYDPNLTIENTSVSNKLYQGDSYSVKYNGYNVTIENKTKNRITRLNLSNLLAGMSQDDKLNFIKTIQKLPAEVLEDMAIELDNLQSTSGVNMHTVQSNPDFVAGGFYSSDSDSITTKPQHIVHELGHAIDYHGENNSSRITNNPSFKAAFKTGLSRFIRAGNKQYDYNDRTTWSNRIQGIAKLSNYCTANEKELWAEIYTALTTGSCQSYNTIVNYFPEAIEVGKKLLESIRAENHTVRHNSPTRQIINLLT